MYRVCMLYKRIWKAFSFRSLQKLRWLIRLDKKNPARLYRTGFYYFIIYYLPKSS